MEGVIVYNQRNILGDILTNTENGIYGTIKKREKLVDNDEYLKICEKKDIQLGYKVMKFLKSIENDIAFYNNKLSEIAKECAEKDGDKVKTTDETEIACYFSLKYLIINDGSVKIVLNKIRKGRKL